jgi:hypothetical protein
LVKENETPQGGKRNIKINYHLAGANPMFGLKLNVLPAFLALPWLVAPAPARPALASAALKPAAAHKAKWSRLAQEIMRPVEETASIGKLPLVRNKIINRAYAELYLENPEIFKWAGLAAFASASIGEKMELLAAGNLLRVPALALGEKTSASLNLLSGALDLTYNLIGRGNKAIFDDIYWQHLAYREGGLTEMTALFEEGSLPPELYLAWRMIDQGWQTGDEDLIWAGNTLLLKYEQKEIIQPVLYEGMLNQPLWKIVSKLHDMLGLLITSPVPEEIQSFRDCVPGGNLGRYQDRWKWCVEKIMPAWQSYETKQPFKVRQLLREF